MSVAGCRRLQRKEEHAAARIQQSWSQRQHAEQQLLEEYAATRYIQIPSLSHYPRSPPQAEGGYDRCAVGTHGMSRCIDCCVETHF